MYIKTTIIGLIILLVFASAVSTERVQAVEGYAGISYNIYSEIDLSDMGYFAGVRKKKTTADGKDYIIGGEIEVLSYTRNYNTTYAYEDTGITETYKTEEDYRTAGLSATYLFPVRELENYVGKDNVYFYYNVGAYSSNVARKVETGGGSIRENDNEWNIGTRIGLEGRKDIKDNTALKGKAGVRMIEDYQGYELSGQLNIKF